MFKLQFEDGSTFEGKSFDGSWKNCPDKTIAVMEYYFKANQRIYLTGYQEYNHLIEKVASLGGTTVITKIFIMARARDLTDIFTIDLKCRIVEKAQVDTGSEYRGQEIRGWRKGSFSNPYSDIY